MGKPPSAAASERSVRDDGRRERVLEEAARLLNETGVTGDLLEQLASGLGLTRAALYGYVEDRQDLVFRCYMRSCGIMESRLDGAQGAGSDPFEILGDFVRRVLDPTLPQITALSEIGYLRPSDAAEVLSRAGRIETRLVEILQAGVEHGQVRKEVDLLIAARAILSLVFWLKLGPRWLSEEARLSGERLLRAASLLILDGLAAAPSLRLPAPLDLTGLTPQMTEAFDRRSLAEARRDAILATASRLFNQRGLEATSIDDIARAVGTSKRTILNHFQDKLSLISATQLRGYTIFCAIAEKARASGRSAAEAMAAGVHAGVMASLLPAISPLRVFSGLPDLTAEQRKAGRQASLRLQAAYQDLFEEGLRDGTLRAVDNRTTMLALAGASAWVGSAAPDRLEPAAKARLADQLTDLMMLGLRTRRS
ncbi:TetR family transcriptional regulator [Phenylobacterium sp. LjRoot164]|uniref:TetR/AcrR family transcriptional regulator n=1 Tax=unclassified Phenylobacterium TaxID=2640670 RepID=UPI003ECE56D0